MKTVPIFVCDKELWNHMTEDEQSLWLDWAETLGATRTPKLIDRNPDYPNMPCAPTVSMSTEDILDTMSYT